MHPEHQYLALLNDLLDAPPRPDRTGTGTRSLFGRRMEFDLTKGFPLFTTKRLPFQVIATELAWMLRGDTNVRWLQERGVTIWDEWADEHGDLGPVYGRQWRTWPGYGETIDQIEGVIEGLQDDPFGRRHIVNAWNPTEIHLMALPPCHMMFQFYVESDGGLSCQMYQRSADAFLGLPFNIASYALLTAIVGLATGRPARRLIWVGGDVHLYSNHVPQAKQQIMRAPLDLPALGFRGETPLNWKEVEPGDWTLIGYHSHPHIPGEVST